MHLHKAPVPKAGGRAAPSQTAAAGVLQHNEQQPRDESPPPSLTVSRWRITAGSLGGESVWKTRIGSQSAGPRSCSSDRGWEGWRPAAAALFAFRGVVGSRRSRD